jgi:hypothetical protein
MRQWCRSAMVIVTMSVAAALVPALSASATVAPSSRGSHPNSALCQAYRTTLGSSPNEKAAAAAAIKAIGSGNWKAAQKAYLVTFGNEAANDQVLLSALSGAPAQVRAAARTFVASVDALRSTAQHSTSVAQFSKATGVLFKNKKTLAAATTLSKYTVAQCGARALT